MDNKVSKKIIKIAIVFIFVVIICVTTMFLLAYPTKYKSEIKKYSQKYNLPSSMIASVIKIESNYDKNALSEAGAIGLMQLLPSTAEEIAQKMNINFAVDDLYDVEKNIDFGCYYLRYLYDMFNGDVNNTLSAYNWGLNNVKTWILKGNADGYGSIINIPAKETYNYLKKYRRANFMYGNIFGYDV